MAEVAYNLRDFEGREQHIRVRKKTQQKKRKARINLMPIKTAAISVVFLALLFSVLYASAQKTQLSADIAQRRAELVELKSEYDYFNSLMQVNASARIVEEYATGELGLIRIDGNQVVYITLEAQDTVEGTQNESFWATVERTFLNITEYFAA